MRLFEKLRALRAFEKQHLDFFSTVEDHHLIGEIGYHQAKGKPLTLKQLFLLDVGSVATVQRRLRRLKELGLVQHRRAANDRRAVGPRPCSQRLPRAEHRLAARDSALVRPLAEGGRQRS